MSSRITGTTLVCMTIANPNRGTPAPVMHNAAFDALGLDYVYVAFEPDDIDGAVNAVRALKMVGCSISKPFKAAAAELVDELDDVARRIGVINTIVNEGNRLKGYNTDWIGSVAALRRVADLEGARVAVLGAGATAQAVLFGLKEAGARPVVFNRTEERGAVLAQKFGVDFGGSLAAVSGRPDVEIVVNTTSVGREEEDVLPVDVTSLPALKAVLDVTFTKRSTRLLESARNAGVDAIHGTEMLVEQGAEQFRLFTREDPSLEAMRDALRRHLFG